MTEVARAMGATIERRARGSVAARLKLGAGGAIGAVGLVAIALHAVAALG